jgi:hypothetical protein
MCLVHIPKDWLYSKPGVSTWKGRQGGMKVSISLSQYCLLLPTEPYYGLCANPLTHTISLIVHDSTMK